MERILYFNLNGKFDIVLPFNTIVKNDSVEFLLSPNLMTFTGKDDNEVANKILDYFRALSDKTRLVEKLREDFEITATTKSLFEMEKFPDLPLLITISDDIIYNPFVEIKMEQKDNNYVIIKK